MKFLLVLTFCFLSFSFTQASAATLNFACSPWAPYTAEDMDQQGILAHLAREIAKEANLDVKISFKPWSRVIKELQTGDLDGTYCVAKTAEREKFLYYSKKPILTHAKGFFRLKSNPVTYETLEDITTLRVGALRDSSDETYLKNIKPGQFKPQLFQNDVTGMRMLIGKRFDMLLMSRLVGDTILATELTKDKDKVEYFKDLSKAETYLAVSQKLANARQIIDQLDQAEYRLIQAGKLKTIYQQHGFNE